MEVKMEIARDVYLKKLKSKRNNKMIKIITGLRRSGKSYLMNNIFYKSLLNFKFHCFFLICLL